MVGRLDRDGEKILQRVCIVTANGGSPVQVADEYNLHYGELMDWIRSDEERESRYTKACMDRQEWGKESVLSEMRALALVRANCIFNDDGSIKPPSEWPPDMAKTVSSLEVTDQKAPCEDCGKLVPTTIKRIKFWDKTKALEMMAKNLQLLNVKVDIGVTKSLSDLILESYGEEAAMIGEAGVTEIGGVVGAEAERVGLNDRRRLIK